MGNKAPFSFSTQHGVGDTSHESSLKALSGAHSPAWSTLSCFLPPLGASSGYPSPGKPFLLHFPTECLAEQGFFRNSQQAGGGGGRCISGFQCGFSVHSFGMMENNLDRECPKVPMKSYRLCRGDTFPRKHISITSAVLIYQRPVMCKALTHSSVLIEAQRDAIICPKFSSRKVAA